MLYLRKTQELTVRNLAARLIAGNRDYSGKDYDSSDDEKNIKNKKQNVPKAQEPKAEKGTTEESASSKLNRLLASMQTDDHMNLNKRTDVIVKPGEGNKKKKLQAKQQAESKDIFAAVKRVASLLGEDTKQKTESELLTKLLGGKDGSDATGKSDELSSAPEVSLSDLIAGMKIDRKPIQSDMGSRSEYVRRSIASKGRQNYQQQLERGDEKPKRHMQRKHEAEAYTGSVNLFGSKPLGIFTDPTQLKESADILPTWSILQEQALKIQISHPPNNYFEKVALWTKQGKVWRFPIDNEQDWLDEKDVDFSEHIFLEQHLEGWCPTKGPIRHFMELVCVGLSKNPFISAQDKKDHILWYRDYFESKKDILKDLMSTVDKKPIGIPEQQIESK